ISRSIECAAFQTILLFLPMSRGRCVRRECVSGVGQLVGAASLFYILTVWVHRVMAAIQIADGDVAALIRGNGLNVRSPVIDLTDLQIDDANFGNSPSGVGADEDI